jgi:hypothetical protein
MKGLSRSLANAKAGNEKSPRRVRYDVKNASVTATAAAAGVGFGSVVLGGLPEGNILFLGGISYLQFSTADTDVIATWSGGYGVGTTVDGDGAIAGTEEDLITEVALAAATDRVSPLTRGEKAGIAMFNNTDTSLEANLNVFVTAADMTDATTAVLTVNGYVELVYIVLGDD